MRLLERLKQFVFTKKIENKKTPKKAIKIKRNKFGFPTKYEDK